MGDHTTSDDATRYRTEEELEEWEDKDPIKRFRLYLEKRDLWDEDKEEKAMEEVRQQVDEAVEKAMNHPPPTIEDIFKHTYDEIPPFLEKQLEFHKKLQGVS